MGILDTAANYAANARGRNRPAQVDELIVMNLVDWFSVVLGARQEPAGRKVAKVVTGWGMTGTSPLFTGGHSAPMGAALVNGTLAHCLDYDDLHFPSLSHLSAPTWAAVLALAPHVGADERLACEVAVSRGNPQNPMSWEDLRDKFTPLAEGTLGEKTGEAFDTLRGFERPGSLGRILSLAA